MLVDLAFYIKRLRVLVLIGTAVMEGAWRTKLVEDSDLWLIQIGAWERSLLPNARKSPQGDR